MSQILAQPVFQGLPGFNGRSSNFVLPYGMYRLNFTVADTNVTTTVTVVDVVTGAILLTTNAPDPTAPNALGLSNDCVAAVAGGFFQTLGGDSNPLYVSTTSPVLEVRIQGAF